MPPRHPSIAAALGHLRPALARVRSEGGLTGPLRLLVACSGGADSTALLGLLALIGEADGLRLTVGHVDHGLRTGSAAEAEQVRAVARGLGLEMQATRLTLSPGPGLPARARDARRAALQAMAGDAAAIVLAHTQTDQAETLLMHATRGAGLEGVAAMPVWEAPWLRPLLNVPRAGTRALCERLGLGFVDDPSNVDRRHPRVRVREEVLPVLREHNPRVEAALAALAAQAADAEAALQQWAATEEEARRMGPGEWSIAGLDRVPRAVRSRLLRRVCAAAGADMGALGQAAIASIDRALCARAAAANAPDAGTASPARAPRSWDLRPGLRLRLGRGGLVLGPAGAV